MEHNSPTLQLDLPVEQYEHVKPCEDNKQTEPDPAAQSDNVNGELHLSHETKPDLLSPEQKADDVEVQKSHKHRRRKSAENKSNRNSITSTKMKSLKQIVDKAIEYNKTFTIFGRFPSVRDALKARGWVQNFEGLTHHRHSNRVQQNASKDDDGSVTQDSDSGNQDSGEQDEHLISRLLRDTPVNFIWAMSDYIDWKYLNKSTIVSRFPRVYFTTKVGLCNYLQQTHWFCEAGISNTLFPRCYTIASADDLVTFIYDFRITACISTLKILLNAIDSDKMEMFSEDGRVPLKVIEFAARRCSEYYSTQQHEDIDMKETEQVWDHQWDQFLTWYYQLAHEDALFESATENQRKSMYLCSKMTIEMIEPHWPQMHLDGVTNLWIVKPGAKSRGRGIQVMRKLEDILCRLGTFHNNDSRYVVQKYIERPFLIHNTKFDIRQWFLVTSAYPLTIWMYKESYLRFCSQLFSLNNMHESVHLSNNAIQCKYKNAQKRNQALPDENMWDCYTFQAYLRMIGRAEMWESVIYPGMKESITGTLLAAQEHMEHRKNCFELYGADFMLTDDLVPWLIEINSSPCMSPTTSVTARMCAQCLEDVIKVVIDRKNDKNADTGMFELIYKQHISPPQPYMGMNLTVRGTKIPNVQKPKKKQKHHGHDQSVNSNSIKGIKGFIDDLSQELNKDNKFETKNMETQTKEDLAEEKETRTKENLIEKKESNEPKVKEEEQDVTDTSLAFTDYSSDEDSDDDDDDDDDYDSAYCEISNDDSVKAKDNKNNNLNINNNNTLSNLNNSICSNNNSNILVKDHHKTMALNFKITEKNIIQAGDRKVTNTLLSTDKSIKDHITRIRAHEKVVNGSVPKYSKSDHLKICRRHSNQIKCNMLNEWKCKVDKTRANYEELYLSKLNVLEEKKFQVRIHHGINWKAENDTVEEIVRKLAQPQKKEFLERLPLVRESVQKKLDNKSNKDKERTANDSSTASSEQRILPQIKHKKHYKRASKNRLYAVGMSLSCQRSEKLLLPMGSEQCLGISLSTISNALASS